VMSVKPRSADVNLNTSYDVEVNTGSGNGTITLRLIDDDSVTNRSRGVPLNGNVDSPNYSIFKTPPSVASITRVGNSPTGDPTATFSVIFGQDVTGVTPDDFAPAASGNISGASVVSVAPVDPRTYTVVLNTGSGDGNLGLNVIDNDSIRNGLNVALGGAGNGNGNFTGPAYAVLKSAPLVSSIIPANPNPTAAGTVSFLVTFNQDVRGVDREDFRFSGVGLTNFGITDVSGSGRTYTVTGNTGNGSGTLGLNLLDNDTILNNVGAPLGGRGVGNGNFTGQAYTINKTPPRVTAINRLESSSTNAATVNFTVSFNEAVSRVDPSDFTLVTQGVTDAGITAVTRVNDSFYSVAVSTGRGEGTIGLNLVDNDSIINGLGLVLGGAGANNGNFRGEVYNIDRTVPIADIVDIAPDPRRDKVDAITIRFSEAVRGFDLSDVQLTRGGTLVSLSRATLTSADGITWTLGNLQKLTNQRGDYELLLVATGSGITDAAGNPLTNNAGDQWTNLVSVEACNPGIRRRGTNGANRLSGTEDSDTLLGLGGNDVLTGLDCRDRLEGGKGKDQLNGGLASDTLIGGSDADRFLYSGLNLASALENSLVDTPDQIKDFRFSQSDRIQLDFDDNLRSADRPRGLFNAGGVNGRTLEQAAKTAYRDKNQSANGRQRLATLEAVLFEWRRGTYLSVNDRSQGFAANRDLVINVTGIQLKSGDADQGGLRVSDYFA
jgi:Bacterial Ig-like domain/RTX calcium-binding nonapeptide repeat (4 copies)